MPTPTPTPAPAGISISPVEFAAGSTEQLQAIFEDTQGNAIEEAKVTWSVLDSNAGSINASGLFTAGEVAGSFEDAVRGQATQGQLAATAAVTILPGPLEQVVMAPDRVEIGMGMTQQYVAVGADRFGNRIPGLKFSWIFEGDGGAIDADGLFTAGSKPGTFANTVKATATHRDITRSAATGVTVLPDRIAFVSDRSNSQFDAYLMNVDGTNTRQLTNVSAFSPAWSPSGRRILYHSYLADRYDSSGQPVSGGIVSINDDGSWPRLLADNVIGEGEDVQFMQEPAMSPDGSQIALAIETIPRNATGGLDDENSRTDIFLIDRDGAKVRRLTDTAAGVESVPSWSLDGAKLVYVFTPAGQGGSIWVMDADGSNQKLLSSSSVDESHPSFSPDGTQIIFTSDRDGDDDIYVMNENGLNVRPLTSNNAIDRGSSWSTDGSRIVFASNRDGGSPEIYIMDSNGANQTRLTYDPAFDVDPRWAPRKRGVEVSEASIVIPNASSLNELPLGDITAKARRAVVRIETDLGFGSGFIIDSDGLILTNNHVILDAKKIMVFLEDGTEYTGTVLGRDMIRDLALIEIEAKDLHTLELGDVSRVQLGSEAIVVGYPLGLTGLTVTKGSAASVKYDAGRNIIFVQTDSTVNPGNSGGPLLNMQGQVIGVIVSKIVGGTIDRVGFAISANTVKLYLDRLKAGEVITN